MNGERTRTLTHRFDLRPADAALIAAAIGLGDWLAASCRSRTFPEPPISGWFATPGTGGM